MSHIAFMHAVHGVRRSMLSPASVQGWAPPACLAPAQKDRIESTVPRTELAFARSPQSAWQRIGWSRLHLIRPDGNRRTDQPYALPFRSLAHDGCSICARAARLPPPPYLLHPSLD